jgi:phosphoribosylformimino-5-aminoimidazole carboxamide ribonucleotide (ProFAR) isomerase
LEDIEELIGASVAVKEKTRAWGIDSVIIGKALYEGRFKLEEAIKIAGHSSG